jgi:hypothetical protein
VASIPTVRGIAVGCGPSIGILVSGATPPALDTTVTLNLSAGGPGGTSPTGTGAEGIAANVFTLDAPDGGAPDADAQP